MKAICIFQERADAFKQNLFKHTAESWTCDITKIQHKPNSELTIETQTKSPWQTKKSKGLRFLILPKPLNKEHAT